MAEPGQSLSRNKVTDRAATKQSIGGLTTHFGTVYTAHAPDRPKTLGSQQATHAAASLGIDDPITTPSREWLIRDAEPRGRFEEQHYCYGNVHAVERSRRLIEARYTTSEYAKAEMNPNPRMTDPSNPVHVMPLPGARGNISQTHQLLGTRGSTPDPKGQTIDLPIRSNPREGLSPTEHMIPRHGARKGIADIAVRTADAGYLTRRLVEVVQRVVVRIVDRGTVRGIFVNPVRDRQGGRMIAQSRLIGRVSTDNAYADTRCIAVRNQDTGAEPADQPIAFQKKPISIRSPSVRRSTFWIRRLRHGWSLTHGDSVEPGEAVGIIAGQSIGEPGTQLTLRTFHTGGTFTGGAAQHVRTPFTGTITSDANSVQPTRTRHGHPAWICDDDLSVVTRNEYEARDPTIPSQSLIPVRNNQHVEAKQVIAGVRATAPVPRERVHKYIHSNLYGEMHLGTKVLRRSPGYSRYSNTHILPETCYVRVLSGSKVPRASGARYIFYGGGDRIGARPLLAGRNQSPPDPYTGGYTNTDPCHLHPGEPDEPPPTSNRTCSHVLERSDNLIIPLSLPYSYKVAARGHEKKGRGVSCSFGWHGRCGKETAPRSVPEMQQNEILRVADDGSLNDRSGYAATAKPETIESRAIRVGSVRKKIDIGHDGARRLVTRYHGIVVGREEHFRLISENIRRIVHGFPTHSVLRANGARVGTRMAAPFSDVYGRRLTGESAGTQDVCGEGSVMGILLRRNAICTKEPSGGIASQSADASVPARAPGAFDESMNWNHRRRVVSYTTDKAFASSWRGEREGRGRLATERHETLGESSGVFKLPSWNSLGEGGRGAKEGGAAIQYPHGVNGVGYTGVQPAQPHRLLSDQRKHNLTVEDAPPIEVVTDAPFTKCCASTNRGSIGYTSIRGGSYDMGTGPKYISDDGICHRVSRYPNGNNLVSGQHEGIPRIPPGSQERTSLSIFSSQDNACRIPPSTASTLVSEGGGRPAGSSNRGSDMTIPFIANPLLRGPASSMMCPRHDERGTRLDPIMITDAFLVPPPGDPAQAAPSETPGLPGNTHGTGYSSPCRRLTRHRCLACDILSVDSTTSNPLKDTSEVLDKWFLRNEDRAYSQLIVRKQTRSSDCLCPSSPTRCLPSSPSCTAPRSASPGRLICGGVSVYKSSGLPHQSCQAEAIGAESAVTRSAEPYLASKGATVRGGFGSVAGEGDALVTLVRERLRFEDITSQGPPKIERFLEPRPNTLVSTDPKGSFKSWSSGMAWIFGHALGRLPSARISLERGRVNSVDCIGRGYRSQGVQVADKHVEMIARQVTSKMVALEDGMANASPPGELIEASRARRMDCALEAKITFGPVLLGITRASLNTESFTPEASSRETTRALAGAAIRGQMDWSKGLKESIIVGGTIPAGTGYEGALCRVVSLDESGEISETEGNPFHAENLFLNGTKLRPLPGEGTARDASASICYVEKRL
nr:RNA polymerase beta'' subunit [Selaginella stauntoniana]